MTTGHAVTAFISYAHADEDHHRRLAGHLKKLVDDGLLDSWDDRAILPSELWDAAIKTKLDEAQIILLMVSSRFLESTYVQQVEIPRAIARQRAGHAALVCIILDQCDWKQQLGSYQVLPPTAAPVTEWPDRDSIYAVIATDIGRLARELRSGIAKRVRSDRQQRNRTIFRHTPFRIVGEDYDPFRAFEKVFLRHQMYADKAAFPLELSSDNQAEFVGLDYQAIFATVRDTTQPPGLDCDLIAIPYFLLGHCIERGLLQPLADRLKGCETEFAWWDETCLYRGRLYGVPLSSLTMILAIRADLLTQYGLSAPRTWTEYLQLIDQAIAQRLPIAPAPLQGRDHITLWYDWLNHLYANDTDDLVLYGASRLPAREAAETLRTGTESYLTLAAKLTNYPTGLPHWSTANWDDAIDGFAHGQLLTTMVFNDALDTLRRRMETRPEDGTIVEYLPVPTASPSNRRNGHVEGWILCVPTGTRYYEAANDVLEWFLKRPIQDAYARWGGASAHFAVIDEQAQNTNDGGAGRAFKASVEDSQQGRTAINLVKDNGPLALEVIDRIRTNLYDAVLAVAGGRLSVAHSTDVLVRRVEQRLLSRST